MMADEIFCSEAWARFDPGEVARAGAGSYALPFELARAQAQATLCRYLPKGLVPADDASPVRTAIPVLWLTADGDPQDPPANLTAVPSQEPNSRIVVVPAQEHVVGHRGSKPTAARTTLLRGASCGSCTRGMLCPMERVRARHWCAGPGRQADSEHGSAADRAAWTATGVPKCLKADIGSRGGNSCRI